MTITKKSIFNRATRNLRPSKEWRELYRAVHTIDEIVTNAPQVGTMLMDDAATATAVMQAISLGIKPQKRKGVHAVANQIQTSLYKAIKKNNDMDMPRKWWRMGIHARYKFVRRTIRTMNKIYRKDYKTISSPVFHVYFSANYKIIDCVFAEHYPASRRIGITKLGLMLSFTGVVDKIAHEYTHALQELSATSIPDYIMQFKKNNDYAYHEVPYEIRYGEKEACTVGKLVAKNFKRGLRQYKNQIDGRD